MSEQDGREDAVEAVVVGFDNPVLVVILTGCPDDADSLHLTVEGTAATADIPVLMRAAADEYERRQRANRAHLN